MDGGSEAPGEDWGPFGRPLFNDPSSRALSRVGVVDVGSNSVRMVVFDGAARSPAYFFNEKIMCGLGSGLSETGRLNPEGRKRALAAIKRFQRLAEEMELAPLSAVATAAVREAEDGPGFREEIARETGLRLYVIDGEEEARLSAQGVLLGWPTAQGLVCDIGGSSMELAQVGNGTVGKRRSTKLGPLKLRDIKGGKKGRAEYIKRVINELRAEFPEDQKRLFLVGGSWRAIARLDMQRRGYPLKVLHEYRMRPSDVQATVKWIRAQDLQTLRAEAGISEARMSLVPLACEVLKRLIHTFGPKEIAISSYGIREGLLYEQMPDPLRHRDPLIEACRFSEAKDARIPGYGKALYNFVKPLFKTDKYEDIRLIRAACQLHDVSWRAHPDYRAEVCFDNATRANMGGLKHWERVYLGLALLHRYKNSRSGSHFEPLFSLVPEKKIREAEVLGKAMRFGAMFTTLNPEHLGKLKFYPKKQVLELRLSHEAEDLFGEVAQARFASLAQALNAETKVIRPR
ncbi:Guanosine-5'-triphosphate,3'-diphosphate pyrophosphatase [Pseudoruegeria aquimaris]|uniref:Guanosine-5'-triphosphate,3'-diphosphate pyrophosphatase n=1 Tax=Pseudoruegeria aquimaris TaxID=393663 RepID=A0A1Y5SHM2_9RHOB|nr:Ppx/GppA family phosphatase [Pseudoruegeria aquimaris]SLN39338.1 Guanosine-5'-triphosphate,3'-diphosphate pyrophosphatase [Pseudoruegeria aquimaris]